MDEITFSYKVFLFRSSLLVFNSETLPTYFKYDVNISQAAICEMKTKKEFR